MQKQALILGLLAATAVFSLSSYAQEAQEKRTLEERVEALEKQLEEANSALTGLTDAAEMESATLDSIVTYLQAQSRTAAEMVKTLAEAESQGFVAGINYPSRETLLAGWRSQLAVAQKNVPGAKAAEGPEKDTKKRKSPPR